MLVVDINSGLCLSFMLVVLFDEGVWLFDYFVVVVWVCYLVVEMGEFGVDM